MRLRELRFGVLMREIPLITILGMAAVTYATRASGLLFGRRFPRWFDEVLEDLPGAILMSLIAPAIIVAGVKGVFAAIATLVVALVLKGNIVVPILTGILVITVLRHL